MKPRLSALSRQYQAALRSHLKQGRATSLESVRGFGSRMLTAGLPTVDLIKLHEHILVTEVLPGQPARKRLALVKQAGIFFAVAISPSEKLGNLTGESALLLRKDIAALSQRTVELAATNSDLGLEIRHRQQAEEALKRSERHYSQLLQQSDHLQNQLRQLSRQILSAQEEERRQISRELHDVIAQTLTGITIRLAILKREAILNTKSLDRNIANTQQLVQNSVKIVHQFARELRPAVLDDLGLIPALHSFMKRFTTRTGVRARLAAFSGIEKVSMERRAVLFRVVQEALANVARHAQATHVLVRIDKLDHRVVMKIKDDGKSFDVHGIMQDRYGKRLGLLGMRERLEMVGGSFSIASAPGSGTTITAEIPIGQSRRKHPLTLRAPGKRVSP